VRDLTLKLGEREGELKACEETMDELHTKALQYKQEKEDLQNELTRMRPTTGTHDERKSKIKKYKSDSFREAKERISEERRAQMRSANTQKYLHDL